MLKQLASHRARSASSRPAGNIFGYNQAGASSQAGTQGAARLTDKQACRNFAAGRCSRGSTCVYSHSKRGADPCVHCKDTRHRSDACWSKFPHLKPSTSRTPKGPAPAHVLAMLGQALRSPGVNEADVEEVFRAYRAEGGQQQEQQEQDEDGAPLDYARVLMVRASQGPPLPPASPRPLPALERSDSDGPLLIFLTRRTTQRTRQKAQPLPSALSLQALSLHQVCLHHLCRDPTKTR